MACLPRIAGPEVENDREAPVTSVSDLQATGLQGRRNLSAQVKHSLENLEGNPGNQGQHGMRRFLAGSHAKATVAVTILN
jgi:hypothetical protein